MKTLLLLLAVAASLASDPLAAQSSATIVGTVRDASGAVMPETAVEVRHATRGAVRRTSTDEAGNFVVPALLPGGYEVTAERPGFRKAAVTGVALEVNQTARLDFVLEVGSKVESITVETAGVRLEVESSTLGQVVHPRQIVEMPLNGRNFMQLGLLSAGVAALPEGGLSSPAATFTNRTNSSLIVNGNRESDSSWLIDGVETRGPWMGIAQMQPSIEAIQEFKIQRVNSPAEFGYGAGIVNIVLKTGTNDAHGSVFEFLRNDRFDARGYFDGARIPPLRQNQWGASLGGPVRRDRSYFFGAYESLRQRRTETFRSYFPTVAERAGDFRALADPVFDPATGSNLVCSNVKLFCPVPFPGNAIPASRLNRVARNIAAYWPIPNVTGGRSVNHEATARAQNDFDQIHARFDHRFSNRDDFFARYSFSKSSNNLPGAAPMFGQLFPQKPQNLALGYTHVFRPNWLNEFRFGYNRTRWSILFEPTEVNITSRAGFQNLEGLPKEAWGLPFVRVNGYFSGGVDGSFGPTTPEMHQTTANAFQFVEHFTVVKRRHTLKVGADIRREDNQQVNGVFVNGVLAFAGIYTGSSMADFALGFPFLFAGSTSIATSKTVATKVGVFGQDDYRVTSNLTLNFGLRFDYFQRPVEVNGDTGLWEDGKLYYLKDLREKLPPNLRPLMQVGGVTRGIVEADRNNLSPRAGFAYRPFGNSRTVVRGGYGVIYVPDAGLHFGPQKPPFLNFGSRFNEFLAPAFWLDQLMPDPMSGVPMNLFTESRRNRDPYVQQFNLTLQREAGRNTVFEAAYSGQAGHKLWKRHNANQAAPGLTRTVDRLPYPLYGEVISVNNESNSNYHSLQTKLDRNFANGIALLVSYSWSKSIDVDSGVLEAASTQSRFDRRSERAVSDFDVPHRVTGSFLYDLPYGAGKRFGRSAGKAARRALGGWQLAGITTMSGGAPFYVSSSTPTLTSDIFNANRGDRICDGNLPRAQRRPERWFDSACFADHALGTFGNAGRNILRQGGMHTWDLSLMKRLAVREKTLVQLRAEFFNAGNRTHFARPGANVTQPVNFGVVTQNVRSGGRSREIQAGLKVTF